MRKFLSFFCLILTAQLSIAAESAAPIEYNSPGAAFRALRAKPGVQMREEGGGWLIANDPNENAIWTFAPTTHKVHPTVVKRVIYEADGQIMLKMGVLCGGSKADCDSFVREFTELNEQMKKEIDARRGKGASNSSLHPVPSGR